MKLGETTTRWIGLGAPLAPHEAIPAVPLIPRPILRRHHLGWRFLEVARRHAARIALRSQGTAFTYAELAHRAREFAIVLRSEGTFQAGDRVVLAMDNSPEYVVGLYGTLLAGGIAVPVLPDSGLDRLTRIVEQVSPSHVLFSSHDPRRRTTPPWLSAEAWDWSRATGALARLDEQDGNWDARPAIILCTSGSTGDPKGVMLSHRNLLANATAIRRCLAIRSRDRTLAILPWMLAFGNSVLQSHLLAGAEVILQGTFSYPESYVEAIREHSVTTLYAIPDQLRFIVDHSSLGCTQLPDLRQIGVAGGALSPDIALAIQARVAPAQLVLMYGQTEATARIAWLPPEQLPLRPGSIGQPIPGVRLEIRDERGVPQGPGIVGELWAHSPGVMLGYWNDPEATAATIQDGWLRTGDDAVRDESGWITLRGRKSAWTKIAGHRVHPAELEEFVRRRFPGIDIAVVPFSTPHSGTRLALFLRDSGSGNDPSDQILVECRKHLPPHKVPHFPFRIADFPRTPSGKIDLAALVVMAESASHDSTIPHLQKAPLP